MIEKVEVYKTEDGNLFEDLQEAELHHRKLDFNKSVEEFADKEYLTYMTKESLVNILHTFVKRFNLKVGD